jgi:putative ABC transport system permease protein
MSLSLIFDAFLYVVRSIWVAKLRSFLTMAMIAFGIMALVGILTSIDAIKASLKSNFMFMGSNTFTISQKNVNQLKGLLIKRKKNVISRPITLRQAQLFKESFTFPCVVSMSTPVKFGAVVRYLKNSTHPNVSIYAIDENYLLTAGLDLASGRNFTKHETNGGLVVILGHHVKEKLFPNDADPSGKIINVANVNFTVVGVINEQGSSFGFSMDNACFVPLKTGLEKFSSSASISIHVMVSDISLMNYAIEEAQGIFRNIRTLTSGEENDFEIRKSDFIFQILLDNIQYLTMAATLIGIITLLGASIGLMNIMLVSVSERTREIGIRKALGASWQDIRNQFLYESIFISQMGGMIGILLGVLIGNAISFWLKTPFVIPWLWLLFAIVLTTLVGIIAGLYPAMKAAKLHPIEALRYE